MKTSPRVALLALAGGAALLTTACSLSIDTGGDTVSKSFDVGQFDEIEISTPDLNALTADAAAEVKLEGLNAEVDVDGAADVEFADLEQIEGSVRGAGTVDVPDGTTVVVDPSGSGSVD